MSTMPNPNRTTTKQVKCGGCGEIRHIVQGGKCTKCISKGKPRQRPITNYHYGN